MPLLRRLGGGGVGGGIPLNFQKFLHRERKVPKKREGVVHKTSNALSIDGFAVARFCNCACNRCCVLKPYSHSRGVTPIEKGGKEEEEQCLVLRGVYKNARYFCCVHERSMRQMAVDAY